MCSIRIKREIVWKYPVVGMPNQTGRGYVDYVIWGDTGKIIAVVEAKKASESGDKGRNQGKLYADCIQNMQGKRPIIFYTNGFETYLWDDANSAPRLVSGIFPQKDINAMIERRCIKKSVNSIQIDKQITDRWYQLRAVTKCCENYEKGIRKCLLVMATGTGKTRTAASIVDVMTRSELMGKVLFLADRKELVKQAKDAFYKYIENTTMCNLLLNKDERNAKIIFSTYQTMLHAIDTIKNADGSRFFSPGHFSLIVIDEAHNLEGKVRNSYTTEVSYISLQRTVEQARKIARGLGNTIDKKLKRYYKHLDSVFDSLNLQVKDQDRIAKKENREIERYYLDRNIPALQGLKDCVHDIFLEVSMQFGVDDSYRNKDYDAELEALELQEEFWTAMLKEECEDIFWMTLNGKGKKGIVLANCPKDVNVSFFRMLILQQY